MVTVDPLATWELAGGSVRVTAPEGMVAEASKAVLVLQGEVAEVVGRGGRVLARLIGDRHLGFAG